MERDENVLSFDNSDDDGMENLADEMDFDADDEELEMDGKGDLGFCNSTVLFLQNCLF